MNQKNISYSSVDTQRKLRIERMQQLQQKGVNVFPPDSKRDATLYEVKKSFDSRKGQSITLAGRLKSKRTSGKIAFATIEDESLPEGFQFVFKKDSLPGSKVWTLNFRSGDALNRIISGQKTIETRALNPEEKEQGRYFGDIQPSDTLRLVDVETSQQYVYHARQVEVFQSIDDAWEKGLDFDAVSGVRKYTSPREVKTHYSDTLSPQYLNKIQTNGLVAITIEPLEVETKAGIQLSFDDFKKLIDEGDYLEATGILEPSQSGEPSLFVQQFRVLTKALRPLPEELDYDNTESRYLDRVADFKMNTVDDQGLSIREMIGLKARYWQIWREELMSEGFLEVECPIFEHIPGGAEARPFTTYYNELEQEMFLRISLELPLKKLIAGGFEHVFEIGRIFRNEGSSPQHLQEYTQVEFYSAYRDYNWSAEFVQRVYRRIVKEVLGTMEQTDYHGNAINWGDWCTPERALENGWSMIGGWPAIEYFDAVRYFSNGEIDTENKSEEELIELCKQQGIDDVFKGVGIATLLDKLWKKARVHTTNPFYLILPPVELEPLAKRDPQRPNLTQRWQIVAGGAELGKAFSELNDPVDQFGRFQEQQAARDAGNDEAQFMDKDYVKAMEYGMPPMTGFGTSERFFSFLLGKHIRECVTFPHIRSIEDKKKPKTQVAHAVVLDSLESWRKVNAYSHLCTALGAREGRSLFEIEESKSKDGESIPMNMTHAIINKVAPDSDSLWILKREAESQGLHIAVFSQEMQETSDDSKVHQSHLNKNADEIKLYGVLVYGKKSSVERLTDTFELFGESSHPTSNRNSKDDQINLTKSESIQEFKDSFADSTYPKYWEGTYIFSAESATITNIACDEYGEYVQLDSTIFYPQGGGQPTDIGMMSSRGEVVFEVTKVVKDYDTMKHYGNTLKQLSIGDVVDLTIEEDRRRLNARLHTVSHMVDIAMAEYYPSLKTDKAFCFPEGPYIQYSGELEDFDSDQMANKVQTRVREIIARTLPVKKYYSTKDGKVMQTVDIIGVDESILNTQYCGGTHINDTAEAGSFDVRSITYKKGVLKIKYQVTT